MTWRRGALDHTNDAPIHDTGLGKGAEAPLPNRHGCRAMSHTIRLDHALGGRMCSLNAG